tara:strand:+ start:539 stop:985 length:447 start_codon:yes stop_codon:yes gene_type:complete
MDPEVAQGDIVNPFLILLQEDFLFLLKLIQLLSVLEAQDKDQVQEPIMDQIQFFLQLHPQGEEAEVSLHLRVEVIRVDQEVEVLEHLALLRVDQATLLPLVLLKETMVETEEDFSLLVEGEEPLKQVETEELVLLVKQVTVEMDLLAL